MAVTIQTLKEALRQPTKHFSQLATLEWEEQSIVRSTLFAESRITFEGKRYMLYMPLSSHAMRYVERFLPHKRHLSSSAVPQLTILRDELRYERMGEPCSVDILIEELPDALPLKDAIATIALQSEAEALVVALDGLERELNLADVSHNNLRVDNILLDKEDRAHLIRWYYATTLAGGDREALSLLREQILELAERMELNDTYAPYFTEPTESQYQDVRFLHEGLIAFEQNDSWGFMDSEQRVIIEPKYVWVNDFREGRAEVETAEGMGLIDKEGRAIIPPEYEIVDYNPLSGLTQVRQNGEWALFDYRGEMIKDWGEHRLAE